MTAIEIPSSTMLNPYSDLPNKYWEIISTMAGLINLYSQPEAEYKALLAMQICGFNQISREYLKTR